MLVVCNFSRLLFVFHCWWCRGSSESVGRYQCWPSRGVSTKVSEFWWWIWQ